MCKAMKEKKKLKEEAIYTSIRSDAKEKAAGKGLSCTLNACMDYMIDC